MCGTVSSPSIFLTACCFAPGVPREESRFDLSNPGPFSFGWSEPSHDPISLEKNHHPQVTSKLQMCSLGHLLKHSLTEVPPDIIFVSKVEKIERKNEGRKNKEWRTLSNVNWMQETICMLDEKFTFVITFREEKWSNKFWEIFVKLRA